MAKPPKKTSQRRLKSHEIGHLILDEIMNNTLPKRVWALKNKEGKFKLTVDASTKKIAWLKLFQIGIERKTVLKAGHDLELHQEIHGEIGREHVPNMFLVR